jgi:hypothetical protein
MDGRWSNAPSAPPSSCGGDGHAERGKRHRLQHDAMTPLGDSLIVFAHEGTRAAAFGVHGLTALLLILAGLSPALT